MCFLVVVFIYSRKQWDILFESSLEICVFLAQIPRLLFTTVWLHRRPLRLDIPPPRKAVFYIHKNEKS